MYSKTRSLRMTWAIVLVLAIAFSLVASSAAAQGVTTTSASVTTTRRGTLVGSRAGAFRNYQIDYSGSSETLNVMLIVENFDPVMSEGVGFTIYAEENGEGFSLDGVQSDDSPMIWEVTFTSGSESELQIQIYNYVPGMAMTYSLTTKRGWPIKVWKSDEIDEAEQVPDPVATPAPTRAAAGVVDVEPDEAEDLAASGVTRITSDSVSGSSVGNSGGAVQYYSFLYGGDDALTVDMTFRPRDPSYRRAIGFRMYTPSGVEVIGSPTGTAGQRRAEYADPEEGKYLIQIHNYAQGISIRYSVTLSFED